MEWFLCSIALIFFEHEHESFKKETHSAIRRAMSNGLISGLISQEVFLRVLIEQNVENL